MERLRNINFREIVAAGLVLLGASAIAGCSESRDSSYQFLVECPDKTELEVLEVNNGNIRSFATITCVDESGQQQGPQGMELVDSTDPKAVTVNNNKDGQKLEIDTTTSWTMGMTTSRSNIKAEIMPGVSTAEIGFDGALTTINAVEVKE